MSASSTIATNQAACWSCSAATGDAHFCAACGKIQPLSRGADYFAFFGMPQKLSIDVAALEQRFHSLSWKLHPDNFVRAPEFERQLSLDRSSLLNDAYRTLRDPLARLEYLLQLAGMRSEGQKKQQAPPELLEEVFELNESLDELREARQSGANSGGTSGGSSAEMTALRAKLSAAQQKFEASLAAVDQQLAGVAEEWDRELGAAQTAPNNAVTLNGGGPESTKKKLMERMNEMLNRRSYLRNLVASTQKELAEA